MATEQKSNAVYNPDHYHCWIGYSWLSFGVWIFNRVALYFNSTGNYEKGLWHAYTSVLGMINTIEALPFRLSGYDAFALLAAWCYARSEEYQAKEGDNRWHSYETAMRDTFEECYLNIVSDYHETPDTEDIYNYVKRITSISREYGLHSPSDSQLAEIFYALSVKKPRGTKYHLNTELNIGDVRKLLGLCVVQAVTSPYEDSEKQARVQALCKVLHKVFA